MKFGVDQTLTGLFGLIFSKADVKDEPLNPSLS